MWCFLLRINKGHAVHIRTISSATTAVVRTHRSVYCRTYPVSVVQPDGSTINIRYEEPRKLIKLPLDLNTLSEAEKKARLDKRKPRGQIKVQEEVEDSFDSKKYLKYIVKSKI